MPQFRKKPVVIEAIQFDGTPDSKRKIIDWTRGTATPAFIDDMDHTTLKIQTLEGDHIVTEGDFVIRGIKGEFYPCKPDIFEGSYDPAGRSEESSAELAALAGQALQDPNATEREKRLAGSVLTQFDSH